VEILYFFARLFMHPIASAMPTSREEMHEKLYGAQQPDDALGNSGNRN
jgi:hypothetical protein